MKTKTIHLTLALLTCTIATAQQPDGHKDRRPPPIPPLLALFDTDRDGTLSAEEIQDAAEALGKLDRNNDGEITREEMRPPAPPEGKPPHGHRPPPPIIAALDADKNETISAEELEGAPESLKQLDKNEDGELSPEEIHPHGPPPRRPQGPPSGEEAPGAE